MVLETLIEQIISMIIGLLQKVDKLIEPAKWKQER
jgi:hypothetical protein